MKALENMIIQEEQEQIKKELKDLKLKVDELEKGQFKLTRFITEEEKRELGILIEEQAIGTLWNEYIYIYAFFNGADNYTVGGSTLTPTAPGYASLFSSSAEGDYSFFIKETSPGGFFSHEKELRWRVHARWGSDAISGVDSQTSYLLTLDNAYALLDRNSAAGFKAVDNILYGCTQADGEESLVKLQTIENFVFYNLELRYFPKDRTDFYVDNILLGSLSSNLPNASDNGLGIASFYLVSGKSAVQNELTIEFFEMIQKRTR